MGANIHVIGTTVFVSVFLGFTGSVLLEPDSPFGKIFFPYASWWQRKAIRVRLDGRLQRVPKFQMLGVALSIAGYFLTSFLVFFGFALLIGILPPLLLFRYSLVFDRSLEAGLDAFLVGLADSLETVPNLAGALSSLIPNIEEPMKSEVVAVLAEVKLGRSIDEALEGLAGRLNLPGLDAAVGAALLGKRTGGDLPTILRKIAATWREMTRLIGVVKTKTAEGRSQAWVMGGVPPFLIIVLEWVNPEWLAPMWNDPIGWILLGGAAVAEVVAIVLVRKIMAVEI